MRGLALICLFLSGAAALIYQVSWVRLLSLSMGATSAAISTVLAAFFLGMALGSAAADRLGRGRGLLRVYVGLETVIGLFALAVLAALLHLDELLATLPALGDTLGAKFALAMALLLLPTAAMGATFPVMAELLTRSTGQVGNGLSALYSVNTLGAVAGALGAAFWLIPTVGLDGAVYAAAALNGLVALGCLLWLRHAPAAAPAEAGQGDDTAPLPWRPLTAIAATGLAAIATEVAWSKYLAVFTGTTLYGFAVILAAFLSGIALGAWLIRRRLEHLRQPETVLALGLALTAAVLLLTRAALAFLPPVFEGIQHMGVPGEARQAVKYLLVFLLLLPATILLGALFPLNLRLCCPDGAALRRRVGRAYALNTLASIAGSLAAGFWLIPRYGTDAVLVLAAGVLALTALVFIRGPRLRSAAGLAAGALAVLLLAPALPGIDYRRLIDAVDYYYDTDAYSGADAEFLYLGEGKSSVISLVSHDGRHLKLQANGLNESMLDREEPDHVLLVESFLAYLPYFVHPDPHSAFVIGFGGGVTTRAFTHTPVRRIRVVELEPKVVEAGRAFPQGPIQALDDPRVELEFNDARNTLLLERRRYDLIASQPSHPWLAGAANVFTREFFQLVRRRLTEDGVFAQWINLFRMDGPTLASLFRSFNEVFPHSVSFANLQTGDLILLGSPAPIRFDEARLRERMARPAIARALAYHDVRQPLDLFWYFALSRREMLDAARGAEPNRDTNLLTEVRLAALTDPPAGEAHPARFLHAHFHFDLAPYLPPAARATTLYALGLRFLDWEASDVTRKIIDQLEPLDVDRARALLHATLFWEHDFASARAWYARYPQWDDHTHLRQIRLELDDGRLNEAEAILPRVKEAHTRRLARALILYQRRDWPALARLPGEGPDLARWRLVGLAHLDLMAAGPALEALVDEDESERAVIETLVRYHAARHDPAASDRWARRLVAHDDALVERYQRLAEAALEKGATAYARELARAIAALRPDHPELAALRRRLEAQGTRLAHAAP